MLRSAATSNARKEPPACRKEKPRNLQQPLGLEAAGLRPRRPADGASEPNRIRLFKD